MEMMKVLEQLKGGTGKTVDIVFLQMGGPGSLDEVKPFLANLFSDPMIIQLPRFLRPFQKSLAKLIATFRSSGTKEMYKQIGNGSPILKITQKFASSVSSELTTLGVENRTHVLMRYTEPNSSQVISRLVNLNSEMIFLFPLYPHFSKATTGSSFVDFFEKVKKHQVSALIHWVSDWSCEEYYMSWWIQEIRRVWGSLAKEEADGTAIVFTAHALPKKYIVQGDPYQERIEAAKMMLDSLLEEENISCRSVLSYQSQVGPVEWMEPATKDIIVELSDEGTKNLIMVPLGFVSDHIETLYEIGILYRGEALEAGISNYHVIPPPNDDFRFVRGVAEHLFRLLNNR